MVPILIVAMGRTIAADAHRGFAGALFAVFLLMPSAARPADNGVDITTGLLIEMMQQIGTFDEQTGSGNALVLHGMLEEGEYTLTPIDCKGFPSCAAVTFYRILDKGGATAASVNAWNHDHLLGNLHIVEQHLVLALWFPTPDGLPRKTLERYFDYWKKAVKDANTLAGGS